MSTNRRALGRGLDALIPQTPASEASPAEMVDQVHVLSIDRIVPNPRQPRTVMTGDGLEELAESIRERGVIEPLIVRPLPDGNFELVAGERRLRASARAGKTEVPAIFRDMDDRGSLEIALIENIQREDLNAVDEARAYQRLVEEFGRTHAEISKAVGKNRSTITNLLRLLHLPDPVLEHLSKGALSVGHARVLLKIEDPKRQSAIAEQMIEEGWNVREAEQRIGHEAEKGRPAPKVKTPSERDPQVLRIEEAIRSTLGTEVHLKHSSSGGRIEIRYASDDELERLLSQMSVDVH